MSIYAIVLTEPNKDIVNKIKIEYPNNYKLSETAFLVSLENTLTEKIAIAIRIQGESRIEDSEGVVFKLNGAYSGYSSTSLWEWFEGLGKTK